MTALARALFAAILVACTAPTAPAAPTITRPASQPAAAVPPLIDDLEHRTFNWFWAAGNPTNGLVADAFPAKSAASIASVGFALTAYGVGVERGYITRDQAIERTLATLRFFSDAAQNESAADATGFHGFFYHFLDMQTGKRAGTWVELSTVDTTLLLGGVLFAQSYFDHDTPPEREIRQRADDIYRRVDWPWAVVRKPLVSMGWSPEHQFIGDDWKGYDEGMLVYVLALGSPTHPIADDAWAAWCATYDRTWGEFGGQTHLGFAPLFGHQYSHVWVDFRGIRDEWNRKHDLDYFENSRRATYSQRAYAIANPGGFTGYDQNVWGLTASNGPADVAVDRGDKKLQFHGYTARGAGRDYISDDGTIVPTAAGGSIAFAPEIVIPALEAMANRYGKYIYTQYGFVDAFNPSFHDDAKLRTGKVVAELGWVDDEHLGIDQGPIVLMIENWRSGLVWNVMKRNPYVRKGLERAGFAGGWLR